MSTYDIMYRPQHHPELLLSKSPPDHTPTTTTNNGTRQKLASSSSVARHPKRYTYRPCPICQNRLLVRIHGSLVYKWIIEHFAVKHNEWLHVVVNLHESWD